MNKDRLEQLISSLDGAGRAEAPPYFYSKLRNRLQPAAALSPRLAWRLVTALVIVAALNLATLRLLGTQDTEAVTGDAQGIASEYSISTPQPY